MTNLLSGFLERLVLEAQCSLRRRLEVDTRLDQAEGGNPRRSQRPTQAFLGRPTHIWYTFIARTLIGTSAFQPVHVP